MKKTECDGILCNLAIDDLRSHNPCPVRSPSICLAKSALVHSVLGCLVSDLCHRNLEPFFRASIRVESYRRAINNAFVFALS